MKRYAAVTALTLGTLAVLSAATRAEDWPSFRGPRGDGISNESNVPFEWGPEKNVKWRTELPIRGNGSPIVSAGRVFLSSASEDGRQRSLLCFDRNDGKQLWERTVEFDEVEKVHQTNDYSPATPASDGRRVVVWHGSAGVHCYDFDGNELWSRDLGVFHHIWGYASSPVLYDNMVLLNCGPGERSFMTALNLEDGAVIWTTDEPGGTSGESETGEGRGSLVGSWSTPVITQVDGNDQVLVSMPSRAVAYEPHTGKILWSCEGLANMPRGNVVYTSLLVSDGMAAAMGGYTGPAIGFKLGGSGDVTESNRLWHHTEANPQRIGSGVIVDGRIYMANAGPGIVQCIDLESGEELWRDRLAASNHWGSTVYAGGRLYATDQKGTTRVFAPNPEEFELLATNEMADESSNSTPAISDGEIFLRTFAALYCIAE